MAGKGWFKRLISRIDPRKSERERRKREKRLEPPTSEPTSPPPRPEPQRPVVHPPPGPGPRLGIHSIVRDTESLGVATGDPDALISEAGTSGALRVAREQNESSHAYAAGQFQPGNQRFANQVATMEAVLGRKVAWQWLTDRKGRQTYRVATDYVQWFYYHAIRKF